MVARPDSGMMFTISLWQLEKTIDLYDRLRGTMDGGEIRNLGMKTLQLIYIFTLLQPFDCKPTDSSLRKSPRQY